MTKQEAETKITYEKARSYILGNWFDGDDNTNAVVGGDEECFVMVRAIEALEKADKYRWHDLRKDPEDLPEVDGWYLVKVGQEFKRETNYLTRYFYADGNEWNTMASVIAWRYIEPFEGSDKE